MRNVRATLLGVGIAIAFVVMLLNISTQIWPFMAHVDMQNQAAMRAAISSAPLAAMLWVVGSYFISTFVGAFLACKMSGGIDPRPSAIVGIVLFVACMANNLAVPQPLWMHVASLVAPVVAAWVGLQLARVR